MLAPQLIVLESEYDEAQNSVAYARMETKGESVFPIADTESRIEVSRLPRAISQINMSSLGKSEHTDPRPAVNYSHPPTPSIVTSKSTLPSHTAGKKMETPLSTIRPITASSLDQSVSDPSPNGEMGSLAFQQSHGRAVSQKHKKCSASTTSGRWTNAEHEAFLQGLKVYGREWKKVASLIPTRTSAQIRSHAQKYFAKVSKEQQHLLALAEKRHTFTLLHDTPSNADGSTLHSDQPISKTMESIMKNPSEVEGRVCKTLALLRERYKQLEDQLNKQTQVTATPGAPVSSETAVVLGPASAALAQEQTTLRQAAMARYEMKRLEIGDRNQEPSTIATSAHAPSSCARVSLSSMPSESMPSRSSPSQGGFASSDVIALSMLGGNLGREKIENQTRSTIKNTSCLRQVRDRLQPYAEYERPAKVRKVDEE